MRLPGPIETSEQKSRTPLAAIVGVGALVVVGVVVWLTSAGSDADPQGDGNPSSSGSEGAGAAGSAALDSVFVQLPAPARVLDTRIGATTVDGRFAGTGVVLAGSPREVPILGRIGNAAETGVVAVTVTATAGPDAADLVVQPCGDESVATPSLRLGAWATITRNLVVAAGDGDAICFLSTAPVDVIADVTAFVDPDSVRVLPSPVRILDSRAEGATADGTFASVGLRPESSTLQIPVSSRFEEASGVGALVVSVSAVNPLEAGEATVFGAGASTPEPTFPYQPGSTGRATTIVPVTADGEMCVSTTGRTHLVVELVAVVPASAVAPLGSTSDCPGQTVFPGHRIVAMYGTERSVRLGVLGEQEPAAAALRLAEIAEPWRAGDRPVLPAFELIATLATGTPEDRGVYNLRSSPEFVQQYLDVAREHGYMLILDVQPGQSDFLTEVMYYEEFLRQPDVGLALDPEWRVEPPARPIGGQIGQVDAAEVNAVIEYVAGLVEEEGLPEKLVVVHQFQDRMITNREQLVELPGIALTIHMDGFGDHANKLESWDVIRVPPPLNMGLKLFYDEDIDMLSADEVLAGLFQPIPDLITYQ